MKGFALDESGDVIVTAEGIRMTSGTPLLLQTCRQVIGTNKGEWFLDGNEGIRFGNILTKNPNPDLVRDEVQDGLFQVDDSLSIRAFSSELGDRRELRVRFTAQDADGVTVQGGKSYADG